MLTYEIKNLFDEMKPFNYEYEEKAKIQDDIYYHIGYGLYLKEKTDKVSGSYINKEKISKYPDLEFVGFKEENSDVLLSCDENKDDCDLFSCDENSEVYDLFVYSEGYTSWDICTLNDYIMNHIEEFHIPDVLTDTMNYVSNRLKEAENSLVSIREYDLVSGILHGMRGSKPVNEKGELSYKYRQTEVTKITGNTEYIVVNGKVGIRVKPYIFKFCDPLKYRLSSLDYSLGDGHIYPHICYVEEYSKNNNFAVLYMEVGNGGSVSFTDKIVSYIAYGNYDVLNEIKNMTYYSYQEYKQKIYLDTGKIDDIKSNNGNLEISKKEVSVFTEEDIEENAERIFKGIPWRQEWYIECSLLFEEKVRGGYYEYCYFLNDTLVMITNRYDSDYSRQELPLRLLSYLRIRYRMIDKYSPLEKQFVKYDGEHTFIKEASETERHLMGDEDYEIYRKLKEEYEWSA